MSNKLSSSYLAKNRSHDEIRHKGAITTLNDGIEITTHGISTRLIAWPGTGFQTESIHVLSIKPGEESHMYNYAVSEEAILCLKGKGQVFLRGEWVDIEAGDIAYYPEGISHAIRNPNDNQQDFILVAAISQPPFLLYEPAGYYDRELGVMKFDAIEEAKRKTKPINLSTENELHLNETHPKVRAWSLTAQDIRREGALFNIFKGAEFSGIEVPMRLILWPGYGVRTTGFHFGYADPNQLTLVHTHPISDEIVIQWTGKGQFFCGDRWIDIDTYDCVMAPCGVYHGAGGSRDPKDGRSFAGGFASPPQLDLYVRTDYYKDGKFFQPPFTNLLGKKG